MIAKLLHICNSNPHCFGDKEDFYALKSRLLDRYGTPDGYDVQHIPGKPCWSCEGTGGLYEPCGCYKCGGSGWFKHPVWVTLRRYRMGRYVFHTPDGRSYEKPEPDVTNIEGYVQHANYDWRTLERAALVLALLFERRFFWRLLKDRWERLWIVRLLTRRCIDCKRRTWSVRTWRCRSCEVMREIVGQPDLPF